MAEEQVLIDKALQAAPVTHTLKRETWGSKTILIMAVAGISAGTAHLLRIPSCAAANGGGAFMICYLIILAVIGLPLLWMELALGRIGGRSGRGTAPAIFDAICGRPFAKYFGVLGIAIPLFMAVYSNYVASWNLSSACFSISGAYEDLKGKDAMGSFFSGYTGSRKQNFSFGSSERTPVKTIEVPFNRFFGDGIYNVDFEYDPGAGTRSRGKTAFAVFSRNESMRRLEGRAELPDGVESIEPENNAMMVGTPESIKINFKSPVAVKDFKLNVTWDNNYFGHRWYALFFFMITIAIAAHLLFRSFNSGIRSVAGYIFPALMVFAVIFMVRLIVLGRVYSPSDSPHADWNFLEGLWRFWHFDVSSLLNLKTWLLAAGQIFFTVGVCNGAVLLFSSHSREEDDAVSTGFAVTAAVAVGALIGSAVTIPAAAIAFGPAESIAAAAKGQFNLGFVCLPAVFQAMPFGIFFAALWFLILFASGVFSATALAYPAVVFLKEEMKWSHNCSASLVSAILIAASFPVVFYYENGFPAEMEFWAGTVGIALFGLSEAVLFFWCFGIEGAWAEIHRGGVTKVPPVYRFIMKYIVPLFLLMLLVAWAVNGGEGAVQMPVAKNGANYAAWCARAMMAAVTLVLAYFVKKAWAVKSAEPGK